MKRIRQWLLTAGITLALLLPLASIASADPGDTGFGDGPISPSSTTASDPGDTGFGP